jgi:hypothetical protein
MNRSKSIPRAIALAIVIVAIVGSIYFVGTRFLGDTADEIVETVDKAVDVADKAADVAIDKTRDAKNLGKEILSDVKNGLRINPRITIGSTVFIEGNREISEHAFAEKRFTYFYERESDFAYSKKKINLEGTFVAKAGYKMNGTPNDPTNFFEINISEDGKRVTAKLPFPEILSVEMIDFEIVTDEDGYWNKISKEDRESAVNALKSGARKSMTKTDILEKADQAFYDQIQHAIRKHAPAGTTITRNPLP